MILSLLLIACGGTDPLPAPKVQEPTAEQSTADAESLSPDGTPVAEPDCSQPAPPKPRCPPKPGSDCEQMWKKVEAWEAKCRPEQP
jgi:hypothetical protein